LKARLFLCEAGLALLDEKGEPMAAARFQDDLYRKFKSLSVGLSVEEFDMIIDAAKSKGITELVVPYPELGPLAEEKGLKVTLKAEDRESLESIKDMIMLKSGLAYSAEEVLEIIREFAVRESEEKIREAAAHPDLQIVQSINSVDELDKISNLEAMRVREWYGLHFPELDALVQDPMAYCRIVADTGLRTNCSVEKLQATGFSEAKIAAIVEAADKSKGGELRPEDLDALVLLATEAVSTGKLRDKMLRHVERNMGKLCPNLTAMAGAGIGARLIAKAGSLKRMAEMPASTVQVLGAEKALFRALKTGGRPPKHGIIFQHPAIHAAPLWQRGKVARLLGAKLVLAARIDYYSGKLNQQLVDKMNAKLEEIKKKYPEPKPGQLRKEPEQRGGRREDRGYRGKREYHGRGGFGGRGRDDFRAGRRR
jgi:nucleolar protein 56